MGRAAFMAADFSDAIAPLSRYLRSHPGDSGIRGALAMSQFMTHNYRSCIEAAQGGGRRDDIHPADAISFTQTRW